MNVQDKAKATLLTALALANKKLESVIVPSGNNGPFGAGVSGYERCIREMISLSQELRIWEGVSDPDLPEEIRALIDVKVEGWALVEVTQDDDGVPLRVVLQKVEQGLGYPKLTEKVTLTLERTEDDEEGT